jgi:hypothetical protein
MSWLLKFFPMLAPYTLVVKGVALLTLVLGLVFVVGFYARAPLKADLAALEGAIKQQKIDAAEMLREATARTTAAEEASRLLAEGISRKEIENEKLRKTASLTNDALAVSLLDAARSRESGSCTMSTTSVSATGSTQRVAGVVSEALGRIVKGGGKLIEEADELRDQLIACQAWAQPVF